ATQCCLLEGKGEDYRGWFAHDPAEGQRCPEAAPALAAAKRLRSQGRGGSESQP
ncbi:hypothetical protein THAOC_28354, partial [Thalassiosira oceanica]